MQNPLSKPLRNQLENIVKAARDVAEKAALASLNQLGVGDGKPPEHLDDAEKSLRVRMRAHGRSLGDAKQKDDVQGLTPLMWEVAYEHWHRMLFARFLAENHLLLWEPGAPVTLEECEELAQDRSTSLGAKSGWELAGKLASRMLPQVFKPNSPVFELRFSPNEQRDLENLLKTLPSETFRASDSLGWVYQFWQAKRKDEVNASEVKIGADELPAVTQLFTEPYMVEFLLHNSLGAWWHTRHPGKPCPVELTYLRTITTPSPLSGVGRGEGAATVDSVPLAPTFAPPVPAAGTFDGWPATLATFKLLDPCCGSGHFLVAAFLLLVPMRMAAEGLSARDAVDAILRDNLHGLEIDPRCVEIAVFALALAAWRFPDESGQPLGVRSDMPAPNVACCGLKVSGRPQDWEALVPDTATNAQLLRQELRLLHASFAQAPLLGSLLDPAKSLKNDLATSSFDTLKGLLDQALAVSPEPILWGEDEGRWENALAAQGLMEAARLLDARYHLVITNVPYLARGKQSDALKDFCSEHYPEAKNDLANVFLERCFELAHGQGYGVVQTVMPQNWLFLSSYEKQRELLLSRVGWNLLARLGPGAFDTLNSKVVQAILLTQTNGLAVPALRGVDASQPKSTEEKAQYLQTGRLLEVEQRRLLEGPHFRVSLEEPSTQSLLEKFATPFQGITTGDNPRFIRFFWELSKWGGDWTKFQSTGELSSQFDGREQVFLWENGRGVLATADSARVQGQSVWSLPGVTVRQMGSFAATLNCGSPWDMNSATFVVKAPLHLAAVWCFCSSQEFSASVRRIDQSFKVTTATMGKVPFDFTYWQEVAAERYPNGLPKPYSDDPTQWIFHGHPQPAIDPLQVAVARLLGYTWPAESDATMELSDEARTWIARCQALTTHADDDAIVCLSAVRGEKPCHERLLSLLIDAWETIQPGSWKSSILDKLLADVDCAGKGLEVWLREKFFEQHAKRFHHRPFVWHIWDGLKDGFGALVNYHTLDNKNLERLIHTYLGDWIRTQEQGLKDGVDGAQARLAAARNLKAKLEAILEGEKPYDIFVRWKPLSQQPLGWNPDLNDGVRLNIRPFMQAEVLRHNKKPKLNLTWEKDRGKDVESTPWFKVFEGERINDHQLSLDEKRGSRG